VRGEASKAHVRHTLAGPQRELSHKRARGSHAAQHHVINDIVEIQRCEAWADLGHLSDCLTVDLAAVQPEALELRARPRKLKQDIVADPRGS
jgi:hypothetical protein